MLSDDFTLLTKKKGCTVSQNVLGCDDPLSGHFSWTYVKEVSKAAWEVIKSTKIRDDHIKRQDNIIQQQAKKIADAE